MDSLYYLYFTYFRLTKQLTPEVINAFKELGSNATTFEEAKKDEIIKKKIEDGINRANSR